MYPYLSDAHQALAPQISAHRKLLNVPPQSHEASDLHFAKAGSWRGLVARKDGLSIVYEPVHLTLGKLLAYAGP
ncbi:MAG: hypothetical protein AAF411_02670 [Myxococcota bacterium]